MAAVAGTDDTFVVDVESVSLVPNGLEYSRTDRSWRRSATGTDFDTVLLANGSVGKVPRPLCFPGDEKLGVAPRGTRLRVATIIPNCADRDVCAPPLAPVLWLLTLPHS